MEQRGSLNAGAGPAAGHPWTLWVSLMGGVMGTFLLGFNTGVMNLLEVQIEQELAITSSEFGFAVSMYPLGGGAGALLAGRLADSFGRRSFMLMLAAPFIVGGIMPFAIQTLTELVVQRLLIGMASGAATVVTPVYLSEIAPADLSGVFGACTQLSTVTGILVGQLVCYGVDEVSGRWRTCLATVAFLALFQLALFPFMAPSPKWLLFRQRPAEAREALIALRPAGSKVDTELVAMGQESAADESTPLVPSAADQPDEEPALVTQLYDIMSHPVRRRALVASVGLQLAQQMSGINLVFFFSGALFARVGMRDPFVSTVLAGTVNVLATAGAVSIIDRVPRRTLLTIGSAGMLASCLVLTVFMNLHATALTNFVTVLSILAFVAAFELALGPMPFIIVSELFEIEDRGAVSSVALAINWGTAFTMSLLFVPMLQLLGGAVFLPFAVVLAGVIYFVQNVLPETLGRSVKEVHAEIAGHAD